MRKIIALLTASLFIFFINLSCKKDKDKDKDDENTEESLSIELAVSPCPVYFVNMQGSSVSSYNGPTSIAEKWSTRLGDEFCQSLVIGADGTIFVCGQRELYAVSADGALKWTFKTDFLSLCPAPVVDKNGVVYIAGYKSIKTGTTQGAVIAVKADGSEKWRFNSPDSLVGGFFHAPTIGLEGYLYVGEQNTKTMYALDGAKNIKWQFKADYPITSSAIIAPDKTIYFSTYDLSSSLGAMIALGEMGTKKWEFIDKASFTTPAIMPNGNICLGIGYKLIEIKPDGSQRYSRTIAGGYPSSPLVVSSETIYTYAHNDNFNALMAHKGGLEILNIQSSYGIPTMDNSGLLYLLSNASIVVYDPINKVQKTDYNIGAGTLSLSGKLVIGNGVIYIATSTGYLKALGQ